MQRSQTQEKDPWLGGPSGSARYTEPQRRKMIDACIKRDGVRGCSCKGCRVHPKGSCPLVTLGTDVDIYRILTVHEVNGPGDFHLSALKAFCQPCNRNTKPVRKHNRPVSIAGEREKGWDAPAPTLTQQSGTRSELSPIMRARWLSWINDRRKGPFALVSTMSVKQLAKMAPRELARRNVGEVSLGVMQTYLKYIEQDDTDAGGPLHVFVPKDGDLKGVQSVEYVGREQDAGNHRAKESRA